MVPWKCGKLLVWDTVRPDTLALSYSSPSSEIGSTASLHLKQEEEGVTHAHLNPVHSISPVTTETSGVLGSKTLQFVCKHGD